VQLRSVLKFAWNRCASWQDLAKPRGRLLAVATLDMHHLNEWVIRPATKPRKCSCMELLADSIQQPQLFVTHSWSQRLLELMGCIAMQLETRQLADSLSMWMCAFAMRSEDYLREKKLDPREGAGYKALRIASGQLLALDPEATAFGRSWCLWELSVGAVELGRPLDIATCDKYAHAGLLTHSLTEAEEKLEKKSVGLGYRARSHRQANFQLDIVAHGLEIKVQSSQATEEVDRRRILNSILQRKVLTEAPWALHGNYDKLNCRVRAQFAKAMWDQALETDAQAVDSRLGLPKALKDDVWSEHLALNFNASQRMDDQQLSLIAGSIPKQVLKLELQLFGCSQLTNDGLEDLARNLPEQLKTLTLNFQFCTALGQTGLDALAASLPSALSSLRLNLDSAVLVKNFASLGRGIQRLDSLRLLYLDASGLENLGDSDVSAIADVLKFGKLRHLYLSFKCCIGLCNLGITSLVTQLPKTLTVLNLDFSDCGMISDEAVDEIAASLYTLPDLAALLVNVSGCPMITEASASRFVKALPNSLRGAKLNLTGTKASHAVQKACRRLDSMRAWMPESGSSKRSGSKTSDGTYGSLATGSKGQKGTRGAPLHLRSIELLFHRGHASEMGGGGPGSRQPTPEGPSPRSSDGDTPHMGRSASEPWIRPMKPLLPKIARPEAVPTSMIAASHPESMFSRPRTNWNGLAEPIWRNP